MRYEVSVRPAAPQGDDADPSRICDDLPQAMDDLSRIVPAVVMDKLQRELADVGEITDDHAILVKEWREGFLWRVFLRFAIDEAGTVSVASVAVNPP